MAGKRKAPRIIKQLETPTLALLALWDDLSNDAREAFMAEVAAGKFDRLGGPVQVAQDAMSLHTMMRTFT